MRQYRLIRPLIILLTAIILAATPVAALPQSKSKNKNTTTTATKKKSRAKTPAKSAKTTGSKTQARKSKKKGNSSAKPAKETSADVRKRKESAEREIQLTKEQIRENEKSVKLGLSELGKLQTDIGESKKKVAATSGEVAGLDKKISTLESQISESELRLNFMRDHYREAIRKVRANRHSSSTLAFIFSAENFNQALRRMRYLRKFSEWKEKQSKEISAKVESLRKQTTLLAATRADKNAALRRQQSAQSELESQYKRQDAIVVELKKNGTALQNHLAKKQAEANQLRNRISSLIAAEQREAQERERKAEEERLRAERQKAAEEERLRAAEEKAALEKEKQAETTKTEKEDSKSTSKAEEKRARQEAERLKKEKKEAERKKKEAEKKEKKSVRKRKDKVTKETPAPKAETPAPKTPSRSTGGNFASQRGSLPRPVSGEFRITSPFGRHVLPDLPDIMYDNPGIDAEVSAGATAAAVYPGKVSGVYVIPGFSTVVIVNHGEYYTVYGNIASPSVKVGDAVSQGQGLGRLAPDEDNPSKSMIHFEVWKNRDKLNPSEWIR